MSTDYYLKIAGISGESTDRMFTGKNTIELSSWGWRREQSLAHRLGDFRGRGGAGGAHRAAVLGPHVESLKLPVRLLREGETTKTATLTAREAGGGQKKFCTITLEEVFITSYSTGGSLGDIRPFDHFSLAFGKITIDYLQQDKEKGTTTSAGKKSWDLRTNKSELSPMWPAPPAAFPSQTDQKQRLETIRERWQLPLFPEILKVETAFSDSL